MAALKQSTAYTRMFLMVQSADHVSALTGASPTVNISKAGGSFSAAGGTVTEVANGFYKIALTTTDTGTLGDLAYHITAASGDPTDFVDQVCANILGDTLPADAQKINGVSTSSVTTINANIGTAQPTNFTGTGGSALVKSDMVDIAGSAVSTSAAQIGVNAVNIGGTAQTGRDVGASVLLSSGTGAGQISLSSGTVTVGTNNDKTGYTASTVSDKTGYALTSGERNSVADALLDRDMSTGADSGSTTVRTVRQALRFLRNKWAISSSTLTVYKEDDSTSSWTASVTATPGADPITGNDPAGP
jgi:hypothetical protein